MRRGWFDLLTLTAWRGEGTSLPPFDCFETNLIPKSSTVLSNVSLSVGAPVRVYLHSLVRRLLYSHLTPSTLSSPSHPSSVFQCTPILTPPSFHIAPWVTMSGVTIDACLLLAPVNATDWASPLFVSTGSRGWDEQKTTTPAEEVIAGRAQCSNTPSCSLDQCILLYDTEEEHC